MLITLPFPISVNDAYANVPGRGRVKTARHVDWFRAASVELAKQLPAMRGTPLVGEIGMIALFGQPDKRRRDLNNLVKVVEDFLVRQVIIADDSLIAPSYHDWGGPPGTATIGLYSREKFFEVLAATLGQKNLVPHLGRIS